MRLLLRAAALSLCTFAALWVASTAHAAETYLGTVFVTDAGQSHNLLPEDGGSFYVPPLSYITVQPSAAAFVCVDQLDATGAPSCTSTNGLTVAQDVAFPSSCKPSQRVLVADGGLVSSCVVTIRPVSGASVNAKVWQRMGNEIGVGAR